MGRDESSRYKLTDEEIIDLVITVMYSGYETVSTTSMMAVKYLHDHPKALEELRVSAKALLLLQLSYRVALLLSITFCSNYVIYGICFSERAFGH